MREKLKFFGSFLTALALFTSYTLLALLICSLVGCTAAPQENSPQADSQTPTASSTAPHESIQADPQPSADISPAPLSLPVREHPLAAGFQDYYAIRADGVLVTWGSQEFGGFEEAVPFSEAVELLPNAAAVYTSGRGAILAVDRDGGLWAVNTTQFNETVPGVNVDMEANPMKPVKIMDGVAMAAMDQFRSIILKQDGTLWVNGFGNFGAPWLNETGSYLVQVMDNVIWADINYAVTADHELWGWGHSPNSAGPEKLLEGVTQVSTLNTALTEAGDLLIWDMDYDTGKPVGPTSVLQGAAQCGQGFAIKTDGTLWIRGAGWSSEAMQEPFHQVMEHVSHAAQGELSMLAVLEDGSLWELTHEEDGELTQVRLGDGFYASQF